MPVDPVQNRREVWLIASGRAPTMDPREISARLHDILRDAYRISVPGSGVTAEASICSVDAVKGCPSPSGGSRRPRPAPRVTADAAALPEGRIPGTRILVQHRRRGRAPATAIGQPARKPSPMPREVAEQHFRPIIIAGGTSADQGAALAP